MLDPRLLLALAIVVGALGLFGWHLVSTTRKVGILVSESRVPRRYILLGVLVGAGVAYAVRRW